MNVFSSLIQGTLGAEGNNLEAVVLEGETLRHFWRNNADPAMPWNRGQDVTGSVVGPGSLIQSDFGAAGRGNFEVVVPVRAASGDAELRHFWHDNADAASPWRPGQTITGNVAGPASLIQSDFRSGTHGNFELVVPLHGASGSLELWHFFHVNSDARSPWQRGQCVAAGVAGPGALIQSDFTGGGHGNFEVLVPIPGPGGRLDLWHYFHINADVRNPWQRGQMVASDVAGSATLIQSDFRGGGHGNFEAAVPLRRPGGQVELWHYFHINADVRNPWQRGQLISDSASGGSSLIQRRYGPGEHKEFDVLVDECSRSVVAYRHPNHDINLSWVRHDTVVGEPPPRKLPGTRKIVQLTGEFDREGWNGTGEPRRTPNQTQAAPARVRGTDLGVSFEHGSQLVFLFGDTVRVDQTPDERDLDSIATTTDATPDDGLALRFLAQPPRISHNISQRGFEVPLDGVSVGDDAYVFFSTDHRCIPGYEMGRSVLTRTRDLVSFDYLGDVSRGKFINVSVERAPLTAPQAAELGWAAGTDVVWIWGSGRYRSSAIYVAVVPLSGLATLSGIRYFAGGPGAARWSSSESDARALFCSGSVGELSVRFNPVLARYLALFNSSNPRGILMHSAPDPWGPWTPTPVQVFDPGDGYCHFMHANWQVNRCDRVQDDMFGGMRDNEWGGEYGPYQIPRYARPEADGARIYFTMSTWNPYQVVLMTATIPRDAV
jgi:Domain of unknown function (DUF4185)